MRKTNSSSLNHQDTSNSCSYNSNNSEKINNVSNSSKLNSKDCSSNSKCYNNRSPFLNGTRINSSHRLAVKILNNNSRNYKAKSKC